MVKKIVFCVLAAMLVFCCLISCAEEELQQPVAEPNDPLWEAESETRHMLYLKFSGVLENRFTAVPGEKLIEADEEEDDPETVEDETNRVEGESIYGGYSFDGQWQDYTLSNDVKITGADSVQNIEEGAYVQAIFVSNGDTEEIVELKVLANEDYDKLILPEPKAEGSNLYLLDKGSINMAGQSYTAETRNQTAVRVLGPAKLLLTESEIIKTGDSSNTEESHIFGLNAAVVCAYEGTAILQDVKMQAEGNAAGGVFAFAPGSSLSIETTEIEILGDDSFGVGGSYLGEASLNSVDITTTGNNSPAIFANGGIFMVVSGTLNTSGDGSPGVLVSGELEDAQTTLDGVTISTQNSPAAVINGNNHLRLNDCIFSSGSADGTVAFESDSSSLEDAEAGALITGGDFAANAGPVFGVSNIKATIEISDARISSENETLLSVTGYRDASVDFLVTHQALYGDITCGVNATANIEISNQSLYEGAVNSDNTAAFISIKLDETSLWSLKGTSYVHSFKDNDKALRNIRSNGHNIYYDADAEGNEWLNGETHELLGGGKLLPME